MENFCSNFEVLQQANELVLQNIAPTFACEQHKIQSDFATNHSYASLPDQLDGDFLGGNFDNSQGGGNIVKMDEKKRKGPRKSSAFRGDEGNTRDEKKRKIMLRDIERQRRQEMANLYASLRVTIPLEFLKGKRSVSDLIDVAANYIKHHEKNIEELKTKRDTLKNLTAPDDLNSTNPSSSSTNPLPIDITVRACLDGIEILISVDQLKSDAFQLSRVLNALTAEGLNVLNCFSSKVKETILHTIQTEVGHPGGVDIYKLQQKLTDVVDILLHKVSSGSNIFRLN